MKTKINMIILCTMSMVAFFIISNGMVFAEEAPDQIFRENIQNYVNSIRTFRFNVEFQGDIIEGVEDYGNIKYDAYNKYSLVYDKTKSRWKVRADKMQAPLGEYASADYENLILKDVRTTGKTKNGVIEYLDRETDGQDYAVLYSDVNTRDTAFRYTMQIIDPVRYLSYAILPREGWEYVSRENKEGGNLELIYRHVEDKDKHVHVLLDGEHDYLPIKIANVGAGWGQEKYYCSMSYGRDEMGIVVESIEYKNRSGKGELRYMAPRYNSPIAEEEFQVNVPVHAAILDERGKRIVASEATMLAIEEGMKEIGSSQRHQVVASSEKATSDLKAHLNSPSGDMGSSNCTGDEDDKNHDTGDVMKASGGSTVFSSPLLRGGVGVLVVCVIIYWSIKRRTSLIEDV